MTPKSAHIDSMFTMLDSKNRNYIEYSQIEEYWGMLDQYLNENDLNRLKNYVQRYYKDTKITKTAFLKIMSFYINDD